MQHIHLVNSRSYASHLTLDLGVLGEYVPSLTLWTILTAVANAESPVEAGGNWVEPKSVVKLLHSCFINRGINTWRSWLDTVVCNMQNGMLGVTSIIPLVARRWRRNKAMFDPNHKRLLGVQTTVAGVTLLGYSVTCFVNLTTVSRAFTWIMSKSTEIIVF